MVVRYSGGQQAGHTVCYNGIRHVFSNFGSGSLRGLPTYWSEHCTVDPVGIINELNVLTKQGINPILYIDGNAPVTTPYDKYDNQESYSQCQNGTCGVGVGSTYQREADWFSLTFNDLFYPKVMEHKLHQIKTLYYDRKTSFEELEFEVAMNLIRKSANVKLVHKIPQTDNLIFEGSQGLLLDQHYGFFPNVTRSNTGTTNIVGMGFSPDLYLITRAYQTRHGNGYMTNEDIPHGIISDPNETNQSHEFQGEFRRSILDLDLLLYGISKDTYIRENIHNSTLVITCLDHLIPNNEYRLTYNGKVFSYQGEYSFICAINHALGVGKVLTNRTPYSNIIR